MNILSDTESSDSDTGRRYKTDSTRAKEERSKQYRNKNLERESRDSNYLKQQRPAERYHGKYEMYDATKNPEDDMKTKIRTKNESSVHTNPSKTHRYRKSPSSKSVDEREEHTTESRDTDHCKFEKIEYKTSETSSKQHEIAQSRKLTETDSLEESDGKEKTVENFVCGPSLPPHMTNKVQCDLAATVQTRTYGPSLPDSFMGTKEHTSPRNLGIGLNNQEYENEDDDSIGPVLGDFSNKSQPYFELEKRALELKLAKLNEFNSQKPNSSNPREKWMIELPELRTVSDLGLTARQFKTKTHDKIKDRSIWTETPEDKKNKIKKGESLHDNLRKVQCREIEKKTRKRKDIEQELAIRKHNKQHKRDESLVEIHQKKMKKDSSKNKQSTERRPFSRDTDLSVNRFDEAQKKSILKKAQLLDTRFSSGQTKYL